MPEGARITSYNVCYTKLLRELAGQYAHRRLFTNILTHPHFIAYRVGPKCLSVRISEALGAMRVCWTARPTDDHAKLTRINDAIIFEHYRPESCF